MANDLESMKQDLGRRCRQAREKRGLTRREVAHVLECDGSTLSRFEAGKTVFSSRSDINALIKLYELSSGDGEALLNLWRKIRHAKNEDVKKRRW